MHLANARVEFVLKFNCDTLDPDEVSQILGVTPDSCWTAGSRRNLASAPRTTGQWVKKLGSASCGREVVFAEQQVIDWLVLRERSVERIRASIKRALYVAVYGEEQRPYLIFVPELLALLGRNNVSLEVDVITGPE